MSIDDMSMDDKRRENIARNNQFLESLGLIQQPLHAPSPTNASNPENSKESIEDIRIRIKKCTCKREADIDTFIFYLSQVFTPTPSLLVYGESGCGKSCLCLKIVSQLCETYCYMSCTGFSNTRQFFQELWEKVVQVFRDKRPGNKKQNRSISIETENGNKDTSFTNTSCTNYYHFCQEFEILLKTFFEFSCQEYNRQSSLLPCSYKQFVLVFDDLHVLHQFDVSLSRLLLNLGKNCHPMVKVIGLSRPVADRIHDPPCIVWSMRSYSVDDLAHLVVHIARRDGYKPPVALRDMKQHESSFRQPNVLLYECDSTTDEKLWDTFFQLVRDEVIPIVGLSGSHPRKVLAATKEFVSRSSLQKEGLEVPQLVASCCALPVVGQGSTLWGRNRRGNEGLNVSMKTVMAPLTNWIEQFPVSCRFLLIAAFLASKIPSSSDSIIFGCAKKGQRRKRKVDATEGPEADEDNEEVLSHSFTLERLMSIYVQIVHHGKLKVAETRDLIGGSGRGRQSLQSQNQQTALRTVEQTFGTAELLSSVNRLVCDGYLQSSSWGESKMMSCELLDSEVKGLAANVSFPLQDYFAENDDVT